VSCLFFFGPGDGPGRRLTLATCRWGTRIVDGRLRPGAKVWDDMVASHIRQGLSRNELLAEVFQEMWV
jgi:hypothetical protein